jgi:hypothetical protein
MRCKKVPINIPPMLVQALRFSFIQDHPPIHHSSTITFVRRQLTKRQHIHIIFHPQLSELDLSRNGGALSHHDAEAPRAAAKQRGTVQYANILLQTRPAERHKDEKTIKYGC